MSKKAKLDGRSRLLMRLLHELGVSYGDIAAVVNRPKSAVWRIVNHEDNHHNGKAVCRKKSRR